MNLKLIIALVLGFITVTSYSQIKVDVHHFKTTDGFPYIDVIINIPGDNCNYKKLLDNWQSTTNITVIAESKGEVVEFSKVNLKSPQFTDSTEAFSTNQIHLERFSLPTGIYQISIKVNAKFDHLITKNVTVPHSGMPEISSILLVEAYAKSLNDVESKFYRSGFEIVPLTGNEISTDASQLTFYTELYNINDVVGEDSLFLLVFGLTDSNGSLNPNNTRYKRINAKSVTPIFETLPVSLTTPPLSGGKILIQAKTRNGNLIAQKSMDIERFHSRTNSHPKINFAKAFENREILYRHLEDHLPLASPSQQNTIGRTLKHNPDIRVLQGFLEQFWIKKSPDDPEGAWSAYCGEILIVDSVFGGCRGGHGADTDMGYVYLKYGKPNTIVKRHHDTDYYPYEIWHYNHTNGFTNRRFLFYAPHVVLECMEILQTDMPGEIQNEDWLRILKSRENRVNVIDSQINRLNPRDTFSREEPEDLYYNPR